MEGSIFISGSPGTPTLCAEITNPECGHRAVLLSGPAGLELRTWNDESLTYESVYREEPHGE